MNICKFLFSAVFFFFGYNSIYSQSITGVWRGKVKGIPTELKLVKNGDQLVGVAYYYQSKNKFKKYSVKGHFDPETNSVIWWDEMLLEDLSPGKVLQVTPDPQAQMTVADFNCPGGEELFLDGQSSSRDNNHQHNGEVHLEKKDSPLFPDEWDYIIENYFVGTNDPQLIDSISHVGWVVYEPEIAAPVEIKSAPPIVVNSSIETKFSTRKNVLQTVIPITANMIELRFYDNAQVDGDSIALYLNGRMLLKNIRLTEQPYTVLLNKTDLLADNELVMVAENLGSIPPNTSFMVAIVGDKRYEARLYANEKSSALIRIVDPALASPK